MNTPDWAATERANNADRYSDMCNAAEREECAAAEADKQMDRAITAIRKMNINVSNVRQLLSTIAATAVAQGWTTAQVYPLDVAQDELDE